MRVVVTGGAGFIGANLCAEFCERGHEVAVIDDLSAGQRQNLGSLPITLHVGSILQPGILDVAFAGADAVIHLAAIGSVPRSVANPVASHAANATGTVEVLEAVRRHGIGHVSVASSSSVYGANPVLPKREDLAPMPVSPYAASKLATESYALAWGGSYDIATLAFRFFNVFGPLQPAGHAYAAVIPAFLEAAVKGRPLPIHGDGTQSRDFTFVGSVVKALADATERRIASTRPVNLAFGNRITLLDVADEIETILGRRLDREHLPRRLGDVDHSQADTVRLMVLFPDAMPVPFSEGLARTIDWFECNTLL